MNDITGIVCSVLQIVSRTGFVATCTYILTTTDTDSHYKLVTHVTFFAALCFTGKRVFFAAKGGICTVCFGVKKGRQKRAWLP